ncbi:MAG TPA: phosphatidate cytidylyltransferase [Polyangia bacterium]|nr:phosphatidate cytidylyltransferase [Polyangia bacterium]
MSNLLARVLTAVLLVPFLVVAIVWSNPLAVWGIVFVATFLGLREYYNMTLAKEPLVERGFGIALGLGFAAVVYWTDGTSFAITATLAGVTIAAFLFYLFRYGDMQTVAGRVAQMIVGTLYVGLLLTFVALLKKRGSDGAQWVFIALTCTWFSDTGAYFAGRFIGPAWPVKLYAAVSPKKTLIGAIGGLVASFGALVIAKLWYLPSLTWIDCVAVAVPANLLGQTGDLCESMLKRSVGVKDSGALLPGHGGMLDRVDALLFIAPYVYVYAHYCYGRF